LALVSWLAETVRRKPPQIEMPAGLESSFNVIAGLFEDDETLSGFGGDVGAICDQLDCIIYDTASYGTEIITTNRAVIEIARKMYRKWITAECCLVAADFVDVLLEYTDFQSDIAKTQVSQSEVRYRSSRAFEAQHGVAIDVTLLRQCHCG